MAVSDEFCITNITNTRSFPLNSHKIRVSSSAKAIYKWHSKLILYCGWGGGTLTEIGHVSTFPVGCVPSSTFLGGWVDILYHIQRQWYTQAHFLMGEWWGIVSQFLQGGGNCITLSWGSGVVNCEKNWVMGVFLG